MSSVMEVLRRQVGYLLSLPERTIRSLAAMATGTTSLLTETLFPEVLRGTTLYKVFMGDVQRFVIENVAEVHRESLAGTEKAVDERYVPRKMLGSVLETAGLFAMHLSPLWVFAIVGDAAAGSTVFLQRLVQHLKRRGVVAADAEITGLNDLLTAMQEASRASAAAVDTPPLKPAELSEVAESLTTHYRQFFSKVTNLLPRFDALWERMETLASRENVSLERLSGILTVDVASWGRKGLGAVLAVGQAGSELFGEEILDSYSRTLDAVAAQGATGYLRDHLKPFLAAAAGHFNPEKRTWTESVADVLLGRSWTVEAAESPAPQPACGAPGAEPSPGTEPPPTTGS